ncbi:MAG: hypothetical protein IJZ72_00945 [Oscillospiraceae bacterium]|nr:hypothetical protein [Oscillospiraceae bacterium]
MTNRNGIKTAAVISCTIFAVWVVLTLAAYVFQDDILKLFGTPDYVMEETKRVVPWAVIVQSLFSTPVILSCGMIMKEKGGALPLIISGIASMSMPVVTGIVNIVQNILSGYIIGASSLVRIATAHNVASWLSYLLNAACIIAVAAAAVHFYASKNGDYKKEKDIEE